MRCRVMPRCTSISTYLVSALATLDIIQYSNAKKSIILPDSESRRLQNLSPVKIFENNAQSVVYINTLPEGDNGSGWVLDKEGHVVTNYHVIKNADSVSVTISVPTENTYGDVEYKSIEYEATVVGEDPANDVAVLKVDANKEELKPIPRSVRSNVKIGESVYVIGSPFQLDHSMSKGIISGKEREITSPSGSTITNILQTDCSVNPGSFGGPLIDGDGEVIGMITSLKSTTDSSAGIGFAVSMDSVQFSIASIIKNGNVERPGLGVSIMIATDALRMGLTDGVMVADVKRDSVAYEAGLRGMTTEDDVIEVLGDVIKGLDEYEIHTVDDLSAAVNEQNIGDIVTLSIWRTSDDKIEHVAVEVPIVPL